MHGMSSTQHCFAAVVYAGAARRARADARQEEQAQLLNAANGACGT
jgi:hypothetical protein